MSGHALQQGQAAQHLVGDVVAEQDAILAAGFGVEKAVETGDRFNLGARQLQFALQAVDGLRRDPALLFLHFAQYLQHIAGIVPVSGGDRVYVLLELRLRVGHDHSVSRKSDMMKGCYVRCGKSSDIVLCIRLAICYRPAMNPVRRG
ncbi:hypothetical protein GALL_545680 [mine drainage metagenome]|uniref:Uncharacterized protein n=1 Tax=mine drainage metagenome TaxID=410659 RepID=A0A1J5P7W4_9ZZZZ